VNVAQYYAYLNSTYPNNALARGELAGIAYRYQQYLNEGHSATVARNQGQFGGRDKKLQARNETSNYGGLT